MRENAVSIIKQRRLVTLEARSISTSNDVKGTILVDVKTAGIDIKSVYDSLLALESFYTRQTMEGRDSMLREHACTC